MMARQILMAAALLAMAQPAQASIGFAQGMIDIQGTGGAGGWLGLGNQGSSFTFTDYSACDGQEDDCLPLPFGGRYANGSYGISLAGNSLRYRFDLWHGTDIGGPLGNDVMLEAWFISDAPVRLYTAGRSGVSLQPGCSGCTQLFDIGNASASQRPDGRWEILFSAFMQANTNVGSQRLFQEGTLKIAAVPEPASWALLFAGFVLTGARLRRRRYCAV